ncbi:MAG: hypothetical protein NZM43_09755 [Saprospiraceae bacterium]|nr:hypothetical protein [Saprospiraceae bacterium]MDW8484600.1 hypothetical protein [Saprospiraceae bacterium]
MHIPFNSDWYIRAEEEQRMRAPHMMTKFIYNDVRLAGQLRGLVIEHHVSGWFRQHYPSCFVEPDNYQRWKEVCSHDFKLITPTGLLHIDVSGPRKDGSFGSYALKPKQGVDYHILCRPVGFIRWDDCDYQKGFEIIGVVEAPYFQPTISPERVLSLAGWLKHIGL